MDKKILIIGAAGLIGSALYEMFIKKKYIVYGADKELIKRDLIFTDITQKGTLKNLFSQIQPDVLMLTAALSHVDYCEEHPEESEKINIQGIKNVLDFLNPDKINMVFFSSDYIFDGFNGPYSENDEPNPLSVYGKHKLIGEEIIRRNLKNHLIIRTTGVYGPEIRGKNFVLSLIKKMKNEVETKVPVDQIATPTYSLNLAEVIEELISKNKCGIYNIAGRDLISRFNFALEICSEFNLNKNLVIPVKTEQLNQKAKRPLKAGLKIDKIKSVVDTEILGINEGLNEFKKELEEADQEKIIR